MIATFENSFFDLFTPQSRFKCGAIYLRNILMVLDPYKSSLMQISMRMNNNQFADILIEYNSGIKASFALPLAEDIHPACLEG
jgi:hypothetical protein|mmetsp:Transcript_23103/g.3801  ORF Transcript_23103/g.3801 Transcript_23103/m.3801 type:complete len:83 (+) Transcript_23103:162-410(+)